MPNFKSLQDDLDLPEQLIYRYDYNLQIPLSQEIYFDKFQWIYLPFNQHN